MFGLIHAVWAGGGAGSVVRWRAVSTGNSHQFAIELARIASDNHCDDVVVVNLRGVSPVTDDVVIATGTSDRQMRGLADSMIEYAKKVGERPFGFCGTENAVWIVIDFVDVVVHLFDQDHRTFYDLELLWGDAPRVHWARSESA